jgi:hypothetical protein
MGTNCWACGGELIWGGDHDLEDDESEEFSIITNLSCRECGAYVLVQHSTREGYEPEEDD